ncbi:hypothetical protein D623_10021662 [Myotis brandtii]|uniref:Uncharacterized protein n=1 Tax=Myotis brandtii TaxID=109478 RepID=S7NU30_MYOBR|nr:hypothetical protein D623_10021662 [Myotis brandtii]
MGSALPAAPTGYLKPRAEEERRVAAEEKKRQDELKRIERELAEDFLGRTSAPSDLHGGEGPRGWSRGVAAGPAHSLPLTGRDEGRGHQAGV